MVSFCFEKCGCVPGLDCPLSVWTVIRSWPLVFAQRHNFTLVTDFYFYIMRVGTTVCNNFCARKLALVRTDLAMMPRLEMDKCDSALAI